MTDQFYRDLSDRQLIAAYVEVIKNMRAYPDDGWEKELDLLLNVINERDIDLGDVLETKKQKSTHGGKRDGSGRPPIGLTKKVSITLPDYVWEKIDEMKGDMAYSAFFRSLILSSDYDWGG